MGFSGPFEFAGETMGLRAPLCFYSIGTVARRKVSEMPRPCYAGLQLEVAKQC